MGEKGKYIEDLTELYGLTPEDFKGLPELKILQPKEEVIGKFKQLRRIHTKFGDKMVIDLETDKGEKSILITHKDLARKFGQLLAEEIDITGETIRIINLGKRGRFYRYYVELVKEKESKKSKR